jgi:hypothetical protein
VELQAVARTAERVRENDVRAGVDEGAMQVGNALRMIGIPKLGRVSGLQAAFEQIAADRTVGEKPRPFGQ